MSVYKDVERGELEDGENLRPLLAGHANGRPDTRLEGGLDGRPDGRIRPQRPANIGLQIEAQQPQYRPPIPPLPERSPSSASSTVNNTPAEVPTNKPWRRRDRRLRRLNTELLEAIDAQNAAEVERLLNGGANPNATCRLDLVSACHTAAIVGGESLALLIKFGAEKLRIDRLGRTPLHLATYAGHAKQVAILLDFPEGSLTTVNRWELELTTAGKQRFSNGEWFCRYDDVSVEKKP